MKKIASLSDKLGQAAKLHRLLEKDGLTSEALQCVVDDVAFRKRLVLFWNRRGVSTDIEESKSQKSARKLMGKNIVGFPEVAEYFHVVPTEEQMAALAELPFSEKILKACHQTHVLVADFGLSILDVRSRVDHSLFYSREDAWYNNERFAQQATSEPCWRLIRKNMVSDSISKTWDEQKVLLDENEEVPPAHALVYTIILFYLARGERMLENVYVRTNTVGSDGYRVYVGYLDSGGLYVNSRWDDSRVDGLGVSSARKY